MNRATSAALLILLALGGCLEFGRASLAIDVHAKHMKVSFSGITSDIAPGGDVSGDVNDLRTMLADDAKASVLGDVLGLGPVKYGPRKVTDGGDRLDGALDVAFERLSDVRISGYDALRPYRYCPPRGMTVASANAAYRDGRGCVIWDDTTQILRVELVLESQPRGTSLVAAWRALGR